MNFNRTISIFIYELQIEMIDKIMDFFKKHKTIIITVTCFLASASKLDFPAPGASLISIERDVRGITKSGKMIFLAVGDKSHFVGTPFYGIKKFQDLTFGKMSKSHRYKFPEEHIYKGNWQGVEATNDKIYLLDGTRLRVGLFSRKKPSYIDSGTIAWDILRPPRDASGEPTKSEVAELRRNFKRQIKKTKGVKFTGLAKVKPGWSGVGSMPFLISTRIAKFPLLAMNCKAAACRIARACSLSGKSVPALDGVAVSQKRKVILLADAANRSIYMFRYVACLHLPYVGKLILPKKIKTVTAIHVDDDDRLWLTSNIPDDYNSATVYVWEKW